MMKQDKGRGVLIMERNKQFDKCLALLNSEQFAESNKDPTATVEMKIH